MITYQGERVEIVEHIDADVVRVRRLDRHDYRGQFLNVHAHDLVGTGFDKSVALLHHVESTAIAKVALAVHHHAARKARQNFMKKVNTYHIRHAIVKHLIRTRR